METTFTFKIEHSLAQRVKNYAEKKGDTISNIIENYFLALVNSEETNGMDLTAPIASALIGSLRPPDKLDYKEEFTNMMMERNL